MFKPNCVFAVVLTGEEIDKLVSILIGAQEASVDMKEPEVGAEIGRIGRILTEAKNG